MARQSCCVCAKVCWPSNFLSMASNVTCSPECHKTHRAFLQSLRRAKASVAKLVERFKENRWRHWDLSKWLGRYQTRGLILAHPPVDRDGAGKFDASSIKWASSLLDARRKNDAQSCQVLAGIKKTPAGIKAMPATSMRKAKPAQLAKEMPPRPRRK